MIKIIYGPVGAGKTQIIIDEANKTPESTVALFITDTDRYAHNVSNKLRYLNIKEYDVKTEDALIGFIQGLLAGNYDIRTIFIDGTHRILNTKVSNLKRLYESLEIISDKASVDFVLTVSAAEEDLPDFIAKFK